MAQIGAEAEAIVLLLFANPSSRCADGCPPHLSPSLIECCPGMQIRCKWRLSCTGHGLRRLTGFVTREIEVNPGYARSCKLPRAKSTSGRSR